MLPHGAGVEGWGGAMHGRSGLETLDQAGNRPQDTILPHGVFRPCRPTPNPLYFATVALMVAGPAALTLFE